MTTEVLPRSFFRPLDNIYQDSDEGRQFNAMYFAMLIFACLISLFGLLLNSPAVIIGAMLISPLMGPILSCGLALTIADWDLGGKAVRNLLLSLGEVVAIAALATFLSPLKESTPEIVARTNPNLMDLLVALFSGFAGTLALASRSRGAMTIIPGVAIATAVMPPLATVGYGMAVGQWDVSSGALMLFLTNLGAIVLSAAITFIVVGFRPRKRESAAKYHLALRIGLASLLLGALSVPLVRTLIRATQETHLRSEVADALKSEFSGSNRKLADFSVYQDQGVVSVNASVHTATFIDSDQTNRYEKELAQRINRKVHLSLMQVQIATQKTAEPTAPKDALQGGVHGVSQASVSPVDATAGVQRDVQSILSHFLANSSVSSVQVITIGVGTDGQFRANISASAKELDSPDLWKVAAAELAQKLNSAVKLTGTLAQSESQLTLSYQTKSALRPRAAELKQAQSFLSSTSNATFQYELPPQAGVIAMKRVDWLNRYLKITSKPYEGQAQGIASNQVALIPVQMINAEASAPAPPPVPSK